VKVHWRGGATSMPAQRGDTTIAARP